MGQKFFTSNKFLENILCGVADRYYYSSVPLFIIAIAFMISSNPIIASIGVAVCAWFVIESIIKIIHVRQVKKIQSSAESTLQVRV